MASKPLISLNKVAEKIQEKHRVASLDTITQLREMIASGVVQEEGVSVFEEPTKQGKFGIKHYFSDCEKVIEVWESLYLKTDADQSRKLLERVCQMMDDSSYLRSREKSLWLDIRAYLNKK